MNATTQHIEQAIERMTQALRQTALPDPPLSGPELNQAPSWWLLAVGDHVDATSLEARDQARERLRSQVLDAGLQLQEFVWVWDETDRAQLVVTTLPTRERAERVAERLRQRGLDIRVTPEMK
ncbi:MAG: hypothetical protein PWQ57_1630 [Desulfovibrionales bacterium]|jgi:hypothetical protein|nr:hypothetical protein [Desulfovibrionales bacterium]